MEFKSMDELFEMLFGKEFREQLENEEKREEISKKLKAADNMLAEELEADTELQELLAEDDVHINNLLLQKFNRFFEEVVYSDYKMNQVNILGDIVKELGTYFILSGFTLDHYEDDLINYPFMGTHWNIYNKNTFLLDDFFVIQMALGEETDDTNRKIQLGITMNSNERVFFKMVIYFDTLDSMTPKIAFENTSSVQDYSHEVLLKEMERYFVD